jgi:hypothetical protein
VLSSKRTLDSGLGRLQATDYKGRVDNDRKTRNREQRTDIGKHSFVNRTIQLWNQLSADAVGNLSCKPSNFRKMVRKVKNEAK